MTTPYPHARPRIYHIVHVDRIASIVHDGNLWCDAEINRRASPGTTIGMGAIKQRRLSLPVSCHLGDFVGDYVPFNFCPRSIMLYLLYQSNHPNLSYRGGQGPIVHLEADLHRVVDWAIANGRRWAFSLSNAGATYAQFRSTIGQLNEVNWPAVAATDFRPADIKEGKQAEVLVHHSFPWPLVERIGVSSRSVLEHVAQAIADSTHRPAAAIMPDWYY